ncbi:MAG: hypothetical protein KAQ81_01615 [Deltaproteobacteria bacterium]|nr:hypothetical protein [Deltaproteobacteria bacterium]
MKKGPKSINSEEIKTIPLDERPSKVSTKDFGKPYEKGNSFKDFLNTLPAILAAKDIREVAHQAVNAHRNKKPVIFGMGAHVVKVGLNPLIIDLMQRGIISCIAMNGAVAIHDVEIALAGKTSEDVSASLKRGEFGMAGDAANIINQAVKTGADNNWGMGDAIGKELLQLSAPYTEMSLLAMACKNGIPLTVHVGIGTDTIHMHPSFDGAATGKLSHLDFKKFSSLVAQLEGGVFFNIGSAVIIPEVFLKALSLATNLGGKTNTLTTVNMDFIRHYRPSVNVVQRPTTASNGKGYHLIGHHEIMLPLLSAAILEEL